MLTTTAQVMMLHIGVFFFRHSSSGQRLSQEVRDLDPDAGRSEARHLLDGRPRRCLLQSQSGKKPFWMDEQLSPGGSAMKLLQTCISKFFFIS